MKLGIYGGTFNPVHYGHLRTAEDVRDLLSLDSVLFIPSGETPFDKPDLVSAEHRYAMVQMAIRGNSRFAISDIEVQKKGKSYTVDTIGQLQHNCPGDDLYLILGIDAFIDVPRWKDPDALVSMTNLVVLSRPGCTFTDLSSSPYIRGVSGGTLRSLDSRSMAVASFDSVSGLQGFLCNVTDLSISASLIRDLSKNGKKLNYLLPDSVNSYIISNKLYK